MRWLCLPALALSLILGASGRADELSRLHEVMADFFGQLGYLPVLSPAGQEVGDVYAAGSWRLVRRSSDCFPALPERDPVEMALPQSWSTLAAEASLLANIKSLFNLGASATTERRVVLSFEDARLIAVTDTELIDASRDGCPEIARILSCAFDACGDLSGAPVIIGQLVLARVSAVVETVDGAQLEASGDAKIPSVEARMMSAEAAARVGIEGGAILQTEGIVPVAFAPAFVPQTVYTEYRTGEGPERRFIGIENWVAFDPDMPEHRSYVLDLIDAME